MNQIENRQCECAQCVGAGCTCGCQEQKSERVNASPCRCGCQEGKRCACAA
jgi:hypothetical protein